MRIPLAATAALVLASPLAAQEAPICGGISPVGEWVGGEPAQSDPGSAEVPFAIAGRVPIAGHLVRMFTLAEDGAVRIDVAAVPSGDPYVALFDAEGTEVAADDDGGEDFASSLVADLPAGTYCLAVRSYESGATEVAGRLGRPDQFEGDFEEALPAAEAPAGAGCGEPDVAALAPAPFGAAALDAGVGSAASAESRPAAEFELAEPLALTVTARGEGGGDPYIRLLDATGATLAENDDHDGLSSRIDMAEPLAAGRYCVEIEDLSGGGTPIDLQLARFDPAADRLARIGAMEFPPAEGDSVETRELGTLGTTLRVDAPADAAARWFALDLPAGGLLLVEAAGAAEGADPEVALFDRLGREVARNDDGPEGLDSFLVHRAQPGRYVVGVRDLSGGGAPAGGAGTIRLLLERYVPAP